MLEKVTVKRVGPVSAFKVGAAAGLLIGVLYALFFALLPLPSITRSDESGRLVVFLVGVIVGALGGGITALITAWCYNIVFALSGGLQLDVRFEGDGAAEPADKGKAQTFGALMAEDS